MRVLNQYISFILEKDDKIKKELEHVYFINAVVWAYSMLTLSHKQTSRLRIVRLHWPCEVIVRLTSTTKDDSKNVMIYRILEPWIKMVKCIKLSLKGTLTGCTLIASESPDC